MKIALPLASELNVERCPETYRHDVPRHHSMPPEGIEPATRPFGTSRCLGRSGVTSVHSHSGDMAGAAEWTLVLAIRELEFDVR
jgi:hypothetical protein